MSGYWDNQYWHWPDAPRPSGAAAHSVSGESDEPEAQLTATLWLPDPESRSGWTMRHVWSTPPPKTRNGMGFRKHG